MMAVVLVEVVDQVELYLQVVMVLVVEVPVDILEMVVPEQTLQVVLESPDQVAAAVAADVKL